MITSNKRPPAVLSSVVLIVTGCSPVATPTDTPLPPSEPPPPTQEGILFSEVLLGVHGVDNNLESIELYSAGSEAIDLQDWTLWYRLADGKDEQVVP